MVIKPKMGRLLSAPRVRRNNQFTKPISLFSKCKKHLFRCFFILFSVYLLLRLVMVSSMPICTKLCTILTACSINAGSSRCSSLSKGPRHNLPVFLSDSYRQYQSVSEGTAGRRCWLQWNVGRCARQPSLSV